MSSLDEAIDAPAADPLDAAIDGVAQDRPRLRASLYGAVKQNPDEFARATQLSRSTGLPAPVVARNLPQVEQRSKFDALDAAIDRGTALAVKMESGDFAALAHDDIDSLGAIERTINRRSAGKIGGPAFVRPVGAMRPSQGPEASFVSALSGVFGALPQGGEATRQGLRAQFADAIGSPSMSADALRRYQSAQSETFLSTPSFESDTARGVYSGFSSLVRQVPGLAASILTRSPVPGLAGIGVQTEAEAYAKYRARGATGGAALLGGVGEGVVEVGTELLPMGFLVNKFGKAGAGEFLAGMLAREIPTEQIATLVQDAIDTAVANPDKTWQQYAAERPDAAYQTLVATITQAGSMGAINEVARRVTGPTAQADAATRDAEALAQLNQLAAASRLRTRDPQSFQEFVQAANEDGPVQDIYLDARTLQQSGIDLGALAQASPAVAAQIEEALTTGADLVIPMAEYAARIAGTDLDPLLTPHLRTAEDALSLDDAQRFYQGQADQFKQAAAQVMEEKAADTAWQQSAKVVEAKLFEELKGAGRFTDDVNTAYATLMRDFYVATASRLGITPEEMFARYPIKVAAERMAGDGARMEQGQDARAFAEGVKGRLGLKQFDVWDSGNDIRLAGIIVAKENQKQGTGTKALEELVAYADARGKRVTLTPGLPDDRHGTTSRARLVKFYKRFGFVENKGRNKDFAISDGMFREPQRLAQEPNPLQRFAQSVMQALGIQTQQAEPVEQVDTGGPALDMGQFFNQPAYHGSPYRFDRFTLDHIGSGEGAQAYGWGLYFAERKGVAEYYRTAGTNRAVTPLNIEYDGKALHGPEYGAGLMVHELGGVQPAIDFFKNGLSKTTLPQHQVENFTRSLKFLETADPGKFNTRKFGNIYEVEVPDDGEYLLWDRPLSEQPEKVKVALRGAEVKNRSGQEMLALDPTGEEIINALGKSEAASKYLNSLGIAGIKYLDGTSRDKGEGSFNYVIFDENAVKVLQTFYQPQQGQANRAEIAFGRDITQTPSVITLFQNADLSSFLHEMGHFQLEVLANIASRPDAPAEIVQDMARVLDWFGITGSEEVGGGETAGSLGQPGTDAFANWFGDSKVVDADGKPLITYHSGSFNESEDGVFNTENGVHFGTKGAALERIVGKAIDDEALGADVFEEGGRYYLDENDWPNAPESGFRTEEDARTWITGEVSENYQPDDYEPSITAVYLSIHNPKRVEDQGQDWGAAVEQAKAEGYDGIVYRNKYEDKGKDSYIAFAPTQIKSVNNAGTYDPNNPNILAQGGDEGTKGELPKRRTALEVWQAMSLEEKRPYHEQLARGFEQYLFEGKAPSQELTGLFARFRSWLISVYKSVKALNVEISDDIRQVFDRLVATDEAIKQAEAMRSYAPLFKSAEGMGDTEMWGEYQRTGAEATQAAVDGLQRRSLRDMQWLTNARGRILKQLQADAKAKRQAVEDEVRAEVRAMPVYSAMRFLRTGEIVGTVQGEGRDVFGRFTAEGREDQEAVIKIAKGYRLDTDALAEMYPETMLARPALEKLRGMTRKEGLHPDLVAEMFGMTSGDQLVREIIAAEPEAQLIEGLTDQRVLERYGDLSSPDTIARAVDEAIHNEARARFVATELNAISKGTGPVRAITKAAKDFAAAMIARKKVRDIKPAQHAAAETRAAKAAEKASAAGDTAQAIVEKRNQLVQNHATRAAYDALDEVEKAVKYLRKFDSEGTRKNLDTDYVDQIDQLLERFDLRASVTNKAAEKRAKLAAWVESQREQGFEPDIPPDLIDSAMRKPYRELTLEELRGLVDTVKQIEHLGRLKQKLLTAKDEREFKAIRDEIAASIEANAKGTRDLRTRETTGAMLAEAGNRFLAMHRKMASAAREMDGFADGGPMWEYFIRSMNEAGDRETTRRADATARLYALVKPLTKSGKMGGKGPFFPTLGGSYNREERIAIALNLGNAGNMQRMLDGEGWTPTRLQPLLDTITPEEADFVQAVWDFFESYRPEIGAKERRIYGKEPNWVEPQPVTLGGKTLKGGYYPIKYDPARSGRAEAFADAEAAKAQMRGAYTTATTRRSFTKARAEEVTGRPLLYSFAGLYQGTNEVIHDLSWHEWLVDVNRLLRSLDGPIRTHYGAETVGIFKKAIEDIAAGDVPAQNVFERGLNHVRTGATIAGLGWNLMTALLQPIGLTQSMVRIGPGWVAKGMGQWIKAPLDTLTEIKAKSAMMTSRAQTMQREINEIQNQVRGSKLDPVRATFFVLIQKMQMVADVPTWLGAYEKHTAAGEAEDRAIALADQAVLDAQGGGQMKDLSQIQRGHPALKLFTNFYSFFNVAYNLGVEKTKEKITQPKLYPSLALDYLLLYVLPAAIVTVMRDAILGGDDDEDKLVKKIIADQISYLLGLMVGLREVTAAAQKVAGVEQFKGSYGGPAGLRLFQEIDKLGQQIGQGDADMALFKAADNVGGVLFHYPSGQVNRSVEGVAALIEGKTANPLVAVIGPPKP